MEDQESELKVPFYKIKLDGKVLSAETLSNITEVTVHQEVSLPAMFQIVVSTMSYKDGKWDYLDLEEFKLGSEISIDLGSDKGPLIVGEVTTLVPRFGGGLSVIEVRGFDRLHRLRLGKKSRTFVEVKDSDLVTQIASDWSLSAAADDSKTVWPHVYQNSMSDYDFLKEKARRIGFEIQVYDKELSFAPPKVDALPQVKLNFHENLRELELKLATRYEGPSAKVTGWDVAQKKPLEAKAAAGSESNQMKAKSLGSKMVQSAFGSVEQHHPNYQVINADHADQMVKASLFNTGLQYLEGEGVCAGQKEIMAGTTIEIGGIGRFSGVFYLKAVKHMFKKSGHDTSFKVMRVGT